MMVRLSSGSGKTALGCYVKTVGDDLTIIVQGGNRPHIGAVAIGIPRVSLKDKSKISSTVSVFSFIGHKDDLIARFMAKKITSSLNKKIVLMVGVHLDDATENDIQTFINNGNSLVDIIINYFAAKSGTPGEGDRTERIRA